MGILARIKKLKAKFFSELFRNIHFNKKQENLLSWKDIIVLEERRNYDTEFVNKIRQSQKHFEDGEVISITQEELAELYN